jgi:hypothetical protein
MAVEECEGCGAEVVPLAIFGDGRVQPYERLMQMGDHGVLWPVRHLCRDYLAWHRPADRRDPFTVDVADGWQPHVQVRARMAA